MASTEPPGSAQKKVAVVGSGLAGLATAHLLHGDQHQRYAVTVLECVRYLLPSYPNLPHAGLTSSENIGRNVLL